MIFSCTQTFKRFSYFILGNFASSVYEKLAQNMEFSRVYTLVFFRGEKVADEKLTGIF